ncbi:MAG: glycosyltransferase family 4 protein [Actinomycetota bacterium]
MAEIPESDDKTTRAEEALRILMVSARFSPFVGGTEIHTGRVASELASRGHRVTVLTTDLNGSLPRTEEIDGVEVVRIRAYPRSSDLYFAPRMRQWIPTRPWDLVHVQGYHTAIAPLALRVAQAEGIPTMLTFHSGGHSSRLRNLLRPLQVALLRRYLVRTDALIGVSKFEADLFSKRMGIGPDRIQIIPNGTDRPVPQADGSAADETAADGPTASTLADNPLTSGFHPDDRVILSAGRLVRYKGHHRIIKAMPKILAGEPRARLLILGEGPYEKTLRRLVDRLGIEDRVTFDSVPSAHRDRLDDLFASASVAVVLSDYESHGMVAHEALDAGLPLVVVDRSALAEIAASGSARAVPPRATKHEVAEIVLRCLTETADASSTVTPIGSGGRGETWSRITDRIEALYRDALAPDRDRTRRGKQDTATASDQNPADGPATNTPNRSAV